MNLRYVWYAFFGVFLCSVSANVFLFFRQHATLVTVSGQDAFTLLDERVASMGMREFLHAQDTLRAHHKPLRSALEKYISQEKTGSFSVYVEDLRTGAWVGVGERKAYVPASLLKISTLAAALKGIEEGELALDQSVSLAQEDLNDRSGVLANEAEGSVYTVEELLNALVQSSDNTAARTLRQLVPYNRLLEARTAMGLPSPELPDSSRLSPKQFSAAFRSLYYSTYLTRSLSQYALSLMRKTEFSSQLPAGLSEDIPYAHKIGVWAGEGSFHDCGIVYYPNDPYLLCMMSAGTTKQSADRVLSSISRIVFEHFDRGH